MRSRMGWGRAITGLGVLVIAAGTLTGAQYQSTEGIGSRGQAPRQRVGISDTPDGDSLPAEKRLRALNAERHKSMVSDTEKLVKLARQLDAEIASNPTDELTPEELHKVANIEKLARSVKTKMAESFGGGPQLNPPVVPLDGPGMQ